MSETKPERLFDRRLVERNIDKGLITRKEYNDYLSGLDDSQDRCDSIEAAFVEGVLDEGSEDE